MVSVAGLQVVKHQSFQQRSLIGQGLCRTVFTRLVPDTEYVASLACPVVFGNGAEMCRTLAVGDIGHFAGICGQRSLSKPVQICRRGASLARDLKQFQCRF